MNIEQKIKQIIAENARVGIQKVNKDTALTEELGMNIDVILDMVMEIEIEFGISIEEEALNMFIRVNDLINYVRANLRSEEPS